MYTKAHTDTNCERERDKKSNYLIIMKLSMKRNFNNFYTVGHYVYNNKRGIIYFYHSAIFQSQKKKKKSHKVAQCHINHNGM
jgi:hypothetical protein